MGRTVRPNLMHYAITVNRRLRMTGTEPHAPRGTAGRRPNWPCLTARQELSSQRVGLASPDSSDTHDSNGGRGRRGSGGGVTSYTSAAPVEDREPADIEGARSRSHGPAGSGQRSDLERRKCANKVQRRRIKNEER
jgi:hypothetical protein